MGNKKYAVMLGVIASFSVISVTYAWTWSTSVGNGDAISADKWNALVTQLVAVSVNPDWNSNTGYSRILNKPTIPAAQVNSDWNAASGVAQILNKPTIPAAQVNSDWNAASGVAQILNKPTIPWAVSGANQYSSNSGNVGIGNSNPTLAGLQVDRAVGSTAAMFSSGVPGISLVTNWPGVYFNSYYNGGGLFMGTGYAAQLNFNPTAGDIYITTSTTSGTAGGAVSWNTAPLYIKNNGQVGIGTTGPGARLHVNTPDGTTALAITTPNNSPWALTIRNNTATTRGIEMFQNNDGSSYIYNGYGGAPQSYIGFATNGSISTTSAITAANLNQAPVISTTNRSTLYTSTTAGRQYMGTSVTFTVPAGPNRTYRIGARIMGHASAAGNYLLYSVSNSSSSLAGIPTGLGYPYEYALDTGRHSNYTEGYVTLAPGTYTYYMFVYGGASYTINYHYDPAYTNIMVWPM